MKRRKKKQKKAHIIFLSQQRANQRSGAATTLRHTTPNTDHTSLCSKPPFIWIEKQTHPCSFCPIIKTLPISDIKLTEKIFSLRSHSSKRRYSSLKLRILVIWNQNKGRHSSPTAADVMDLAWGELFTPPGDRTFHVSVGRICWATTFPTIY